MNPQILTLFGEEYAPQPPKPAGKSRAKKKPTDQKTTEENEADSANADEISTEITAVDGITVEIIDKPETEKKSKKTTATRKLNRKKSFEKSEDLLNGFTPDKKYYAIGEVAALFKVNTSHIRFWTKEFSIRVRTTRKGDRLFTPEQINEIRNIYHLVKEKGFTLSGAKTKLKEAKKTTVSDEVDVKQSLLKLRNQLVEMREQLS